MSKYESLKEIKYRKLKNGKNIIVVVGAQTLVVEDDVIDFINNDKEEPEIFDNEIWQIFKENNFIATEDEESKYIIEPQGKVWWICRCLVPIISLVSSIGILIIIPFVGIPMGDEILSNQMPLGISVIFAIAISTMTTVVHEVMHMLYANTFPQKKCISISLKNAVASVDITHTWTWSFMGRLAAAMSGLTVDLMFLLVLSLVRIKSNTHIVSSISAILWIRILWQFRFNKNCDGRLLAMIFMDNPLLPENSTDDSEVFSKNETIIWKILNVIGYIVSIAIIIFWLIPMMIKILSICLYKGS